MRRYSFDGGPEVNQDSGEWVKYADVQAWLEAEALRHKKQSEAHLQEGQYTQARNWEGGWHAIERLLADLAKEGT